MLKGNTVSLRPVRERDIEELYDIHVQIENRGSYWPLDVTSEPAFRKEFGETGFWTEDRGMLVMVDAGGRLLGDIGFFRPVPYLNSTYEIFYRVYDESNRGKGTTPEALRLLVRYLFDSKQCERIQLGIDSENRSSQRVAEKCGFTLDGTMRSAMYHRGRHHDMLVYSVLRGEAAAAADAP